MFKINGPIFALVLVTASIVMQSSPSVTALSGSEFRADRIIDDALFYTGNAMTADQMQTFLNAKVPTCDIQGAIGPYYDKHGNRWGTRADFGRANGAPPPYTCLKDFKQSYDAKSDSGLCSYLPSGTDRTAAQIIDAVARSCNISQKVLLVTLQKEQSLITDDWPWPTQYEKAMGYYCPDDPNNPGWCHPDYAGFFNQVYNAAKQFNRYKQYPNDWNHALGRTSFVAYQANAPHCGGTNLTMQTAATAGLYNYTPYQPNQAALDDLYGNGDNYVGGAWCSAFGNRNFWRMYNDWFGTTRVPQILKGNASGSVYAYINGHKTLIPSMALLQDYGYDPNSILVIDQATMDAIPVSPSPLSPNLSYLTKSPSDEDSDGSAVYLVSVGRKYSLASMDQFNSYGFNVSNISYVPLNYLLSIPSGGPLTQFVLTPTSNVFSVSASQKNIIFDYQKYISLNPSNLHTYISTYTASQITSGNPITDREILVRTSNGAVHLLDSNTYYSLPSMDIFNCWGFDTSLAVPMYTLAFDSYIAPITAGGGALSCVVNNNAGTTYILNRVNKLSVPSSYGSYPSQTLNANLATMIDRMPNHSSAVRRAIKTSASSTIWYLENGVKKPIPSMQNLNRLGIVVTDVDVLDGGPLSSIQSSGIKLGNGQPVKSNDSSSVYAINNGTRIAFANGNDFEALGYSWHSIESYATAQLDGDYPATGTSVNKYLYDQGSAKLYLMDKYGCYLLSTSMATSYGQDSSTIASSQPYAATIFPRNLSSCAMGSLYVKPPDGSTVYWIDGGQKHPISSWSTLVSHSGQSNPYIISLSGVTLQSFPTGPAL